MSYCDHFSSVVRPSVRLSVNIFKRLLLWNRWANFAQISYGASLGWGNEKLLKWSRSVDRWPPRPYMVKTFKNLLLQNRECLGAEPLQESSGMGGLPKLLKELSYVDVWPFYGKVKFASLCICMGKPLKIFFSKTEHALWLNLCIYLREQEGYQNC